MTSRNNHGIFEENRTTCLVMTAQQTNLQTNWRKAKASDKAGRRSLRSVHKIDVNFVFFYYLRISSQFSLKKSVAVAYAFRFLIKRNVELKVYYNFFLSVNKIFNKEMGIYV